MVLGFTSNRIDVIQFISKDVPLSLGAIEVVSEYNHIDLVKWLYDNRPEYYTGEAFMNAAAKGYLELVEWLYINRSTEISNVWKEDHIKLAIDRAAYNGHLDVIKWIYFNETNEYLRQNIDFTLENSKQRLLTKIQMNKETDTDKEILAWITNDIPAR